MFDSWPHHLWLRTNMKCFWAAREVKCSMQQQMKALYTRWRTYAYTLKFAKRWKIQTNHWQLSGARSCWQTIRIQSMRVIRGAVHNCLISFKSLSATFYVFLVLYRQCERQRCIIYIPRADKVKSFNNMAKPEKTGTHKEIQMQRNKTFFSGPMSIVLVLKLRYIEQDTAHSTDLFVLPTYNGTN